MTRQREIILDELQRVNTHPTAYEIFEMVKHKLPRISLGTVYRNLEVLSEAGLIRTMPVGKAPRRFDGMADSHYHLVCVRCGQVEDVGQGMVAIKENGLEKKSGYRLIGHRLKFLGLCPHCKEKQNG